MCSPAATSAPRLGGKADTPGFRFDDCRVRHRLLHDSCTGKGAGRVSPGRISQYGVSLYARLHHENWTGALPSLPTTNHDCFHLHTAIISVFGPQTPIKSRCIHKSSISREFGGNYVWVMRSRHRLKGLLEDHTVQVNGHIHLVTSPP